MRDGFIHSNTGNIVSTICYLIRYNERTDAIQKSDESSSYCIQYADHCDIIIVIIRLVYTKPLIYER